MNELLLLLVGAVLGAILSTVAAEVYSQFRERRLVRRSAERRELRHALDSDGLLSQWIIDFYCRQGFEEYLYRSPSSGVLLDAISLDEWQANVDLQPHQFRSIVDVDFESPVRRDVDRQIVDRIADSGVNLWDGEILSVKSVDFGERGAHLRAQRRSYFSAITQIGKIEDALSSDRYDELQRLLPVPPNILDGSVTLSLSACTALVLYSKEGPIIPFQKRSSNVLMGAGMISLIPTFSLEPNGRPGLVSSRNPLFYNFAREFGEELYNLEELIKAGQSRRVSPDWIFDLAELKMIESAYKDGILRLTYLGISVHPRSNSISINLLAEIDVRGKYATVREQLQSNWETVADSAGESGLQLLALDDPIIDHWAATGQLGPPSIITVDMARAVLATDERGDGD